MKSRDCKAQRQKVKVKKLRRTSPRKTTKAVEINDPKEFSVCKIS